MTLSGNFLDLCVQLLTGGINLTGVTVQRPAVTQLLQQQIAQRALQQHIQVQLQQQQQQQKLAPASVSQQQPAAQQPQRE